MLTSKEILNQINKRNIIINGLNDESLNKPNSCDVYLGNILYSYDYRIIDTKNKDEYYKKIKENKIHDDKVIIIPETGFLLEPHKVYIAKTREKITTDGYIPVLNGKESLSNLGLSIELNHGYNVDNYDDYFLLSIVATKPTIIYPNIKIGNLSFFKSLDEFDPSYGMLSGNEIKSRMKTGDIVITPQDNIVINPNSVNLTLNDELNYYTDSILDLKSNNKLSTIKIPEEGYILNPNEIYLGTTNEYTETNNLVPMISGRSSLGRLGYHAHCSASMGSIGYKGNWHLSIRTSQPLRVYKDMKCCQVYYFTPLGEIEKTYEDYKKLTRKK